MSLTNNMIFGLLASAGFYFTTVQFLTDAKSLDTAIAASSFEEVGSDSDEMLDLTSLSEVAGLSASGVIPDCDKQFAV